MPDIYVMGINLSHDASCALLKNGELVCAIAEERLDRIKHSNVGIDADGMIHNLLPKKSVEYCLSAAGIGIEEIELIVVSSSVVVNVENYATRNLSKEEVLEQLPTTVDEERVKVINHHIGHAASAYYPSGFSEATVIVADGGGSLVYRDTEDDCETGWYEERTSIYLGRDRLEVVEQYFDGAPSNGFLANDKHCSLGDLYQSATEFVGFMGGNEGKTMGLAPYGTDALFAMFSDGVQFQDGRLEIKDSFQFNKKIIDKNYYGGQLGEPQQRGREIRSLDKDVSAGVQYALEEVLIKIAQRAFDKTGVKNLCLAGGIALNSVANKKILDRTDFENIFVQPASGDDGCALGNALFGWSEVLGHKNTYKMRHAYTGRSYSDKEITAALEENEQWIKPYKKGVDLEDVCRLLTKKGIVGWFQGGSEFGPRALGHRSIICDPRHPDTKATLNRRVKHREMFRPFAPSILRERAEEYFDLDGDSPYMLLIAKIKKPDEIPAVTHVDITGRVQTLTRQDNGLYYNLVETFGAMTGVPVLLNTSFNDNEEPIVETPADAIRCYLNTNIDYLVLGDYLIAKRLWKCRLFRTWPNTTRRNLRKWIRRSPLLFRIAKVLRGPAKPVDNKHVRVPG